MLESCLLGLNLVTAHFFPHQAEERAYRSLTPGVYAECENWTAGFVKNSYGHPSEYAGYTFNRDQFSLTIGVIHGYPRAPVLPLIVPSIKLADHFRLSLLPNCHAVPAAISLGIEF